MFPAASFAHYIALIPDALFPARCFFVAFCAGSFARVCVCVEQLTQLCEKSKSASSSTSDGGTGSNSPGISLSMLQGDSNAIWLGGFLSPGAFITATRQVVAQSNKVSLAELQLVMGSDPNGSSFTVKDIVLEGMYEERQS